MRMLSRRIRRRDAPRRGSLPRDERRARTAAAGATGRHALFPVRPSLSQCFRRSIRPGPFTAGPWRRGPPADADRECRSPLSCGARSAAGSRPSGTLVPSASAPKTGVATAQAPSMEAAPPPWDSRARTRSDTADRERRPSMGGQDAACASGAAMPPTDVDPASRPPLSAAVCAREIGAFPQLSDEHAFPARSGSYRRSELPLSEGRA